jgi:hypothetical protein
MMPIEIEDEYIGNVADVYRLHCRRAANAHEFGCATCTFWACNLQDISLGECHYSPPGVFIGSGVKGNQLLSAWPTTRRNQWCGRHLFESAEKETLARSRLVEGEEIIEPDALN